MRETLDRHTLSDFVRRAEEHARHLRDTGEPEILMADGDVELVVQSATAYRALLERVAELQTTIDRLSDPAEDYEFEGIPEAVAEMERGEGIPAPAAFARLRERLGVRDAAP